MKTRSFCAGALRAVLVLTAVALLAACAPPLDGRGEGNLRIILAGGAPSGARAISPATEATLSYRLYFSGPGDPFTQDLEPGTKNITLTLSLGEWTIRAEAYTPDGCLCGGGETPAPVTVAAGRTNDATIPMTAFADITAFSFADPAAAGVLNAEAKTIAVTVPSGTDPVDLVPTIDFRGLSIDPPSGEAQDFANPVAYTVAAVDGDTATWTVTVTVVSNTANDILTFGIAGLPPMTVNQAAHTVTVTVPYGTSLTGLVPAITVSPGATILPASGEAQDFGSPVVYTVAAADGVTEQEWTVTVTVAPANASAANDITAFGIAGLPAMTLTQAAHTVTVTVPFGTVLTNRIPTIAVSPGATILPASGVAQNFGNPITYTVTAENGTPATWTVTVTVEAPVALATVAAVAAHLASATGGTTATNPVPLTVTLNLADTGGNGWADLLGAIQAQTPAKYVALDLSACTMTGMTSTAGEFDPGTANTGESRIVSLVLPDDATSIKAGASSNATFRHFARLASVTGNYLTDIGDNAFTYCNSLTAINLPVVATIGNNAFFSCQSLTTVDLPAVITIDRSAFDSCRALTSVSLPASLTSISGTIFRGCAALASITIDEDNPNYRHSADKRMILSKDGATLVAYSWATGALTTLPAGITSIGENAFYRCFDLTTVTLPTITSIGENAFALCNKLTTVNLPAVTSIGQGAFGSTALTTVYFSAAVSIGDHAFAGCTSLTTVDFPAATTIGYGAFNSCTALTSVVFPVATSIDGSAFSSTGTTLLTVTLGATVPTLGLELFSNVLEAKTVTVKFPAGATGYGSTPTDTTTSNWGNGFRGGGWDGSAMIGGANANINLTIEPVSPVVLTTVAAVAAHLASATGGTTATNPVPLTVTLNLADTSGNGWADLLGAIQAQTPAKYVALDLSACTMTGMTSTAGEFDPGAANTGESRIVSLVLPDAARSIRGETTAIATFRYFTSLASIAGNYLTDVGDYAFYYHAALESVNFPAVTVVDRYAFSGCTALTTVNFPVVQNIEAFAFSGCADLILASLPNSVTNIGQQAFENCYGLTLTSLPGNLAFLGDAAFRRCNLSSISIPASLESIGANPFGGCSFLTTITVANGNPNYRHSSDNRMLLSQDPTGSKTLISYPSAAGAVSLPGIETLGASAFIFCANLTSVDLPDVTTIGQSAFVSTGTTPLIVTLGAAVPTLGEGIFVSVASPKTVTVKVPVGATAWTDIGVDDGATTSNWWGNGFRGGGWDGSAMTNSSNVNANITVTVEFEYLAINDVAAYLASAPGGASLTDDPVFLGANIDFSGSDWTNLLAAISGAGKYVALDLSPSAMSNTVFDPDATTNTGKDLIVSLVLPDAATSIKSSDTPNNPAFRYFDNLESVAGEGILTIGDYAFYNCAGLKWMGLELPGVLTIGAYAFYGCTGLLSVEFGAVTNIGNDAFSGCANLSTADFPEATDIGNYAFSNCAQLSWTDFSEVVTIGNYAFYNCAGLERVGFPEATDIRDSAFSRCTSLARIYLLNAESIGVGVFRDTGGQALEITLGDTAPTLGTGMFTDVSSKDIFVNISSGATGYGSSPTNTTTANWGNGFRGGGWNGTAITAITDVNPNISLTFYPTAN